MAASLAARARRPVAHHLLALAVVVSLRPTPADAAPARQSAAQSPELDAFDAGLRFGQQQYNRGEFLAAARTWTAAAAILPARDEYLDYRAAIFTYIAEAYERAITPENVHTRGSEALETLDAFVEELKKTHPERSSPAKVESVRASLRAMLAPAQVSTTPAPPPAAEPEAAAQPDGSQPAPSVEGPREGPASSPRPRRPLRTAGVVTLGAGGAVGLALLAAGLGMARAAERAGERDAAAGAIAADLQETARYGGTGNSLAVAGAFVLGAAVTVGVALLASRRASTVRGSARAGARPSRLLAR